MYSVKGWRIADRADIALAEKQQTRFTMIIRLLHKSRRKPKVAMLSML